MREHLTKLKLITELLNRACCDAWKNLVSSSSRDEWNRKIARLQEVIKCNTDKKNQLMSKVHAIRSEVNPCPVMLSDAFVDNSMQAKYRWSHWTKRVFAAASAGECRNWNKNESMLYNVAHSWVLHRMLKTLCKPLKSYWTREKRTTVRLN